MPRLPQDGTITIIAGVQFHDKRLEYSGGDLIYRGLHLTHKAATSDTDWYIWKFTWASGDCTRIEGPFIAAWDDRPALGWA